MTKIFKSVLIIIIFCLFIKVYAQSNNAVSGAAKSTLTIDNPDAFQVIQRDKNNQADIFISGKYTGSPTTIEASWDSQPYVVIDKTPTEGVFKGYLRKQNVGQGTLKVRFSNKTGVYDYKKYVGIGDIFVISGQSNASGRGDNNQKYYSDNIKASMFGNNNKWSELKDPTDNSTNQTEPVGVDAGAGGSVWPLFSTHFLKNKNIPIAFIPTAKGGSSIIEWQKDYPNKPGTSYNLYKAMQKRVQDSGGNIKAVLFLQGEADAKDGLDLLKYKKYMNTFANDVYADIKAPIIVAQIGEASRVATSSLDNIRSAQKILWKENPNILPGPNLYDIPVSKKDFIHYTEDSSLKMLADRWWASVNAHFYGGVEGRGPQLIKAQHNKSKDKIVLTFDKDLILSDSNKNLNTSGFIVKDDNIEVNIKKITQSSSNQIIIDLNSKAKGAVTVSLGSGHSGQNTLIYFDKNTGNLPAEFFVDIKTTLDSFK